MLMLQIIENANRETSVRFSVPAFSANSRQVVILPFATRMGGNGSGSSIRVVSAKILMGV